MRVTLPPTRSLMRNGGMTTNLHDFVGNPEAFATQNIDGGYTPRRENLTPHKLQAHLDGSVTIGTYVVWADKSRFFVFDIDDRDLGMAKALAEECQKRGLFVGIEFSGRKGFHVWCLFSAWFPAADVQRLAKDIARTVGFNGEVFPKQAVARDLGSLVKLPLGVHQVTGDASRFLSEPLLNVPVNFAAAVAALPPEPVAQPKAGGGPLKCIDSIQTDPPKEGTRNNLYFHFACHLRRMGLHEEAITAVLESLWLDADPGELESVVANSAWSGPTCDSVPADRHCGESCIKNRAKGLSLRPGQMKNGMDGELIVVKLAGHVKGSQTLLSVEHPDLEAGLGTLRKDDGK